MGWFSNNLSAIFNRQKTALERPGRGLPWWSSKTYTDVIVNHDTAQNYAAVWACRSVITSSVCQMGWHVFRPTAKGRERAATNPVDYLLDIQSNPETNAFTFRETLLSNALLWGNGYAEIERDLSGRPVWLWQIAPDRVAVDRDQSGQLVYDIANSRQSNTVLPAKDVFHLKGVGDGITGQSVIQYAKQSLGLGMGAEVFGSSFLGNGLAPSVIFKHPAVMGPEAQKNFLDFFAKWFGGPRKAGKPFIAEEGMEPQVISVSPEDAQLLETRAFQILEVCRWFNVKPHKIAELTRATFSNIEEQNIEHVTDTCMPWVLRLEQEANVKLFGYENRQRLYTKMNVGSLLRGKMAERNAAYATGRQWGWLSVNDVRTWEDLNPLPAHIGDTYLVPSNMVAVPLDAALAQQQEEHRQQKQMPPPRPNDPDEALAQLLLSQLEQSRQNGHAHAV